MPELVQKRFMLPVEKQNDELGIIWGYVSVADEEDLQGDVITQDEMVKMVYRFMEKYYQGLATVYEGHERPIEAVIVESTFHFVGTVLKWYVGVRLLDEEIRREAREGLITGFSIGGMAVAYALE